MTLVITSLGSGEARQTISPLEPTPTGSAEATEITPSMRAILGALQGRQPMTGADIREVSGLPRRTVYAALRTLREHGVVLQRQSLRDARQKYFWLAGTADVGASAHIGASAVQLAQSTARPVPAH